MFDFELTDTEMERLRALDLNQAYFPMIGQISEDTQKKYSPANNDTQEAK